MAARAILLLALIAIGGTVIFARGWLAEREASVAVATPEATEAETVSRILVAAEDLPAGLFLGPEHVHWRPWPEEGLGETYLVERRDSPDAVHGAVVRRGIAKGEPIATGAVIKPGERGFLAAVLQPGYRGMSVPIDAVSGIAGLIFPGDRVDLILSHSIGDAMGEKDDERQASETILTNVRVLAIDQRIEDQGGEPKVARTATLEVLPEQAEGLALVRQLGVLSLSLRSLARDEEELMHIAAGGGPFDEPEPQRGETHTWDSEVSLLIPSRQTAQSAPQVIVARGSESRVMGLE